MSTEEDANRLAADARARVLVDRQLTDAGRPVQDSRSLNLFAAQGVARRQATMATGHVRDWRAAPGSPAARPAAVAFSGRQTDDATTDLSEAEEMIGA